MRRSPKSRRRSRAESIHHSPRRRRPRLHHAAANRGSVSAFSKRVEKWDRGIDGWPRVRTVDLRREWIQKSGSGPTRRGRGPFCLRRKGWPAPRKRRNARSTSPYVSSLKTEMPVPGTFSRSGGRISSAGVELLIARETLTAEHFIPLSSSGAVSGGQVAA